MKFDKSKHKVACVTFNSSSKPKPTVYEYFFPKDIHIEELDTCIVNSPYDGLTTVTVRSIRETPKGVEPERLKPIIDIVNVNLLLEHRDSVSCLQGMNRELHRLQTIAGNLPTAVPSKTITSTVNTTVTSEGDPF